MLKTTSKELGQPLGENGDCRGLGSTQEVCQRGWGLVSGFVNSRIWPTILVDGSARVLTANPAARALLEARSDWLVSLNGELKHRNGAATAEMHARIRSLGDDLAPTATRLATFVEGSDGQQTLVTMVRIQSPAGASGRCRTPGESSESVVLVTLNDGHRRQVEQGCQLLFEAFAFTPAEARVAFALLDGMSLQAFSDEAGVRISTVRWHVRNALAKTNCANQRDLVRLLISLIDS